MAFKTHTFSSCILLLLFVPLAVGHNVTKILGQFGGFSDFNRLLTQTQLAGEINHRQTLTILAVNNAQLAAVANQPLDLLKKILMVHVVLDYYDVEKLQNLPHRSTILTTMFQNSGLAAGGQGFLNATATAGGRVAIRSAVPGGTGLIADVVKDVALQPYNISVLQISSVIVPPGITGANGPSRAPSPMPVAAPTPGAHAPPAPVITTPPATAPTPPPESGGPVVSSPPTPTIAASPRSPNGGANAPAPSGGSSDADSPGSKVVAGVGIAAVLSGGAFLLAL